MIKSPFPLPLLAAALLALPAAGCERANAAVPPSEEPNRRDSAPPAKATTAAAAEAPAPEPVAAPAPRTILLSAVGDCTLAAELGMVRTPGTLPREYEDHGSDPAWFF